MKSSLLTRQVPLAVCLLLHALSLNAESAAESDWRPVSGGICRGEYVQPVTVDTGSDEIVASAGGILHVEGESTTLTEGFSLRQHTREIQGTFMSMDAVRENYTAEGNVSLREPDLLIKGDRIEGQLFDGAAVVDSASFLMHVHRLRGTASQLIRTSEGNISINKGSFTTCEPGSETWRMTGRTIDLYPEPGYGIARDVQVRIRNVPVAWVPWLRFPIDERRQSGLLVPGLSHDNDGGTDIALPYYFNISPNMDATYTPRFISRRGLMHEGEARYLTPHTENLVAGAYLPRDSAYDGRDQIDLASPGFDEEDRWLGYIDHRGRSGHWTSSISYASVSDTDYFRDLDGFTNTESDFDRSLDLSDSPALARSGTLNYGRRYWGGRLELRSFQQLNRNQPEQFEILPRLTLSGQRQFGGISTRALIQRTEFENNNPAAPTGSRTVADATVALPMRNTWSFFTPAFRVYHRTYNLDDAPAGIRENASLTTSSASLDTGIYMERNVSVRGRKLTQTLEPRLHYLYVEEDEQNDLPVFDSTLVTPSFDSLFWDRRYTGYDRIGDANRFALGVTTRFIDQQGRERLAGSIGQMFHLDDRQVTQGLTPGMDPRADVSPIFLGLSARSGRITASATYEFDPSSGQSNRSFVSVKYRTPGQAVFNFSYAMTDSSVQRNALLRDEEESDFSFVWPVSARWQVIGRWNYGWNSGQTIESLVGVEYNDCCWRARLVFRRNLDEPRFITITSPAAAPQLVVDRRADSGIYFEFQLKGLGSLGGRLDSLLVDAIPGYRKTGS